MNKTESSSSRFPAATCVCCNRRVKPEAFYCWQCKQDIADTKRDSATR